MGNKAYEVNFDGIVGPTHNYSGLAYGNIASGTNQYQLSNPREAALQGLAKMKLLADMGIKQAVLPPHERPHLPTLHALGFRGSNNTVLEQTFRVQPEILFAVSSAACMWTANAATVCPSSDSDDHRVHLTPANLTSFFHRSIESKTTERVLKAIFKNPYLFTHHSPLPAGAYFADEGAANHCRFCKTQAEKGVQLFVFGRSIFAPKTAAPQKYPARQTLEASQAIARLHRLPLKNVVFGQQHTAAIDAGAFHNDVVALGHENLFLYHENTFENQSLLLDALRHKVGETCQTHLHLIEVKANDIPLHTAVATYLFNSQLVTLPSTKMALVAPLECQQNSQTYAFLNALLKDNTTPIDELHFVDLHQSMHNGGGPACLRLRVVLTEKELSAVHPAVFMDDLLYHRLTMWVKKHYRDRLHPNDCADPKLLEEIYCALDELTIILQLGTIYDFQDVKQGTKYE